MDINIPKSSTASHELPIFNELSKESGLPVSEVKARFRRKMIELHEEAMLDPSKRMLGDDSQEMVHNAVNELRKELQHPEEAEVSDEDEYDDIMGFDPTQPAPGSDIFGMDDFGSDADFGGGFGGGGFGDGGGFGGGGIDNLDLGFSDEGMDAVNSVSGEGFDDFGSEDDAGSVNAMSDLEPAGEDASGNEEGGSEEPPASDDSDLGEL